MICYKDMTFCSYYKKCNDAKNCDRKLTPEVIKAAEEWMKDPPICQFAEKPTCFVKIER